MDGIMPSHQAAPLRMGPGFVSSVFLRSDRKVFPFRHSMFLARTRRARVGKGSGASKEKMGSGKFAGERVRRSSLRDRDRDSFQFVGDRASSFLFELAVSGAAILNGICFSVVSRPSPT